MYSAFNATVTTALAELTSAGFTYDVVGMIWMQGESDSTDTMANAYETNLSNLVEDARSRYNADLLFVAGETWRNEGDAVHPGALGDIVAGAQQAVGNNDTGAGFVSTRDTADFTWRDEFHLDANGQMNLGYRFAAEMQRKRLVVTRARFWRLQ